MVYYTYKNNKEGKCMRKYHYITIIICMGLIVLSVFGYKLAGERPNLISEVYTEATQVNNAEDDTVNFQIEKLKNDKNEESDIHLQSASMSASKYANFENVIDKIIAETK